MTATEALATSHAAIDHHGLTIHKRIVEERTPTACVSRAEHEGARTRSAFDLHTVKLALPAIAGDCSTPTKPALRCVSYYNCFVEIHPAARRHGIVDEDIQHAMEHAMTIEDQDDDTRLYLGPSHSAALLEVVTIVRDDGPELAIHAMPMRAKYQRLLPGG
jgi:hypothetical protein